ncbi:hypothetical protein V8C37DRAFT_274721 [Trichoderma ceciliae]
MLNDDELEQAASQLANFRSDSTLPVILDRYAALIQSYKRLKSDYEEERDGRERYKQISKGQGGNPFVLVLIDGDSYVFHESLVSNGADGGRSAAQLLNESIKISLRRKGLEHCQVMVRVYADLVSLSRVLRRAGFIGAEKRSLSPFVASFNRSYGLSDFVDAGEWEEKIDLKLRATLHLYAANPQCKHVYFAGCHDGGYISDLMMYAGSRERFTLITTPGVKFQDEYAKLGMEMEELAGVFQSVPFHTLSAHQSSPSGSESTRTASRDWRTVTATPIADYRFAASTKTQKTCSFYQSGKCKYGGKCKNLHMDDILR